MRGGGNCNTMEHMSVENAYGKGGQKGAMLRGSLVLYDCNFLTSHGGKVL